MPVQTSGLHDTSFQNITKCEVDIFTVLYASVVFPGGTTRYEFPDRNIIESVYVWVTIFSVRVEATRYCQETTTHKNEDYLFPQRHGDVAEVTFVVDNSGDPWSQSSAHGEAFSVIVELVGMADCESTSSLRLAACIPLGTDSACTGHSVPKSYLVKSLFLARLCWCWRAQDTRSQPRNKQIMQRSMLKALSRAGSARAT